MNVIIRPKKVLIGTSNNSAYNWTGILRIEYEEVSPWVHIDIPAGLMVHQHLKSPHVTGIISCINLDALKVALYQTVIDSYNHTAIDTSSFYTKWTVNYLRIITVNESNVEVVLNIDGFKVERIEVDNIELDVETIFKVHFTCDRILIE